MNAGMNLFEGVVGLAGAYYNTVQTLVWSILNFITFDVLQLGWLLPIQF